MSDSTTSSPQASGDTPGAGGAATTSGAAATAGETAVGREGVEVTELGIGQNYAHLPRPGGARRDNFTLQTTLVNYYGFLQKSLALD